MNQQLLQLIVEEICSEAPQNFLGKIFQLNPLSLALDLGIRGRFVFISVEPSSPRLYLTRRRVKDLEKQSVAFPPFTQYLRAHLGSGQLVSCEKLHGERIAKFTFRTVDESGTLHFHDLIVQLTGRSANLFIADQSKTILAALRPPKGPGQNPGETYLAPPVQEIVVEEEQLTIGPSPSETAEEFFQTQDAARAFDVALRNARGIVHKLRNTKLKLRRNLERDLTQHGDPEVHKRLGDLLLANVSTAVRKGGTVRLTDFYSPDTPTIEIPIEEDKSLQEVATESFRRYTKAKRARQELTERLKVLEGELASVMEKEHQLERIEIERDELALADFLKSGHAAPPKARREKKEKPLTGVRRYLSTDGYEILVGRAAKDNDNLTFRIARPNDLWLHAGDYPGSHVVIRNPTRKEMPQRTIIEAAQLAGKFSQASEDAKVVIHFTERKFLSKPKGSAPGLVRMSRFRSITVEPKESVPRS